MKFVTDYIFECSHYSQDSILRIVLTFKYTVSYKFHNFDKGFMLKHHK